MTRKRTRTNKVEDEQSRRTFLRTTGAAATAVTGVAGLGGVASAQGPVQITDVVYQTLGQSGRIKVQSVTARIPGATGPESVESVTVGDQTANIQNVTVQQGNLVAINIQDVNVAVPVTIQVCGVLSSGDTDCDSTTITEQQ
ncbi:hypothetical protein [Halomicrococcus sp. NG-SE-24]|uniref:hypothetical protein n=1 Tax=Halomicrococcus sp. NG-SE-24 TaxID=3436928 RepID=UPI003D99E3C1